MVISRQFERLFDLRTIRRNIRAGNMTKEKYDEYLRSLPDMADNIAPLSSMDDDGEGKPSRGEGHSSPQPSFPRRTDAPAYTDDDLNEDDLDDDDDDDDLDDDDDDDTDEQVNAAPAAAAPIADAGHAAVAEHADAGHADVNVADVGHADVADAGHADVDVADVADAGEVVAAPDAGASDDTNTAE